MPACYYFAFPNSITINSDFSFKVSKLTNKPDVFRSLLKLTMNLAFKVPLQ